MLDGQAAATEYGAAKYGAAVMSGGGELQQLRGRGFESTEVRLGDARNES